MNKGNTHNLLERSERMYGRRDLQKLLDALGFECRIRGDHYIYTYAGCLDIINIQPNKGMAKPYQIKQIRNFIAKYKIKL